MEIGGKLHHPTEVMHSLQEKIILNCTIVLGFLTCKLYVKLYTDIFHWKILRRNQWIYTHTCRFLNFYQSFNLASCFNRLLGVIWANACCNVTCPCQFSSVSNLSRLDIFYINVHDFVNNTPYRVRSIV